MFYEQKNSEDKFTSSLKTTLQPRVNDNYLSELNNELESGFLNGAKPCHFQFNFNQSENPARHSGKELSSLIKKLSKEYQLTSSSLSFRLVTFTSPTGLNKVGSSTIKYFSDSFGDKIIYSSCDRFHRIIDSKLMSLFFEQFMK